MAFATLRICVVIDIYIVCIICPRYLSHSINMCHGVYMGLCQGVWMCHGMFQILAHIIPVGGHLFCFVLQLELFPLSTSCFHILYLLRSCKNRMHLDLVCYCLSLGSTISLGLFGLFFVLL